MKYLEFNFQTTPCSETANDLLAGLLGEAGFESFVEQENGLAAYIQKDLYDEAALKQALADFAMPDTQVTYTFAEAEDRSEENQEQMSFSNVIIQRVGLDALTSASFTSK